MMIIIPHNGNNDLKMPKNDLKTPKNEILKVA